MPNELFLKILYLVLTIIAGLISAYVIPWLKTKVNEAQFEQIEKYIARAVRAAEQLYTPEEWEQKKEFVTDYITTVCNSKFSLSLTAEDINYLIEGFVNEIKRG